MHLPIFGRWRAHRAQLENIFAEAPPVSRGEFYILAALEMMMATQDEVLAKVAEETTVEQGLAALLDGLVDERNTLRTQVTELQAELAAAGQDTTKADAIIAALDSNEALLNASRRKITLAVTTPGSGADSGSGPAAGDTVTDTGGENTLSGGTGDDTVASGSGDDTATDTNSAADGENTLSGGQGDDTVADGSAANTLSGGDGNDVLG